MEIGEFWGSIQSQLQFPAGDTCGVPLAADGYDRERGPAFFYAASSCSIDSSTPLFFILNCLN
jgi:hypothetical protein